MKLFATYTPKIITKTIQPFVISLGCFLSILINNLKMSASATRIARIPSIMFAICLGEVRYFSKNVVFEYVCTGIVLIVGTVTVSTIGAGFESMTVSVFIAVSTD